MTVSTHQPLDQSALASATEARAGRHGWIGWVWRNVPATGLVLGAIFFALSLTPSLLPRTPVIQGVLSGSIFAIGYAIGATIEWTWRYLELKLPQGRITQVAQIIVGIGCAAVVAYCLYRTPEWQNTVRAAMNSEPVAYGHPLGVVLVALVPSLFLIVSGTLLVKSVQLVTARLRRFVPQRVAFLAGLCIVALLAAGLFSGVLLRGALRAADAFFEGLDVVAGQFANEPPPADAAQSGSSASLIGWNTIGRDGREYVVTGPTQEEIAALTQRPAQQPLRVYVSLRSAPTTDERAQLALAELKRINAFDRAALVIITPVGTGWVDPPSINAVEYMLDGDVASVALQYSYLVSPLSLVIEPDYGTDAAQALFTAVYGYWRTLPRDSRPRLYLSGLSLGAHASQSSTQFFDIVSDPFSGALWVGPPFTSPIWRWATRNRNKDSPEWLPRFGDSSSIRFANRGGDLNAPGWGPLRISFLQYPSDPIVFFDINSWYRAPDWMVGERGPGVPASLTWYPVVTFFQLGMDMALSNSSPTGYGHVYSPADYARAWRAIIEPGGWDEARIAALIAVLETKTGRP